MKGKVAFVTGGAQGIGKAYCRELLNNGAQVIVADINESVGKETVTEFKRYFSERVEFYLCDVTNSKTFEGQLSIVTIVSIVTMLNSPEDASRSGSETSGTSPFMARLSPEKPSNKLLTAEVYAHGYTKWFVWEYNCLKRAKEEFGVIDILINNAGICDETETGWRKMIDINFVAVVEGTKLGFKFMSRSNGGAGGTIVNVASITSLSAWEYVPVYSATKAAVNQLSRSYGTELHYNSTGVKVVSINPGLTDTNILKDVSANPLSDRVGKMLPQVLESFPVQKVENMGKGLIFVLYSAQNGSIWTIEEGKPPMPTILK